MVGFGCGWLLHSAIGATIRAGAGGGEAFRDQALDGPGMRAVTSKMIGGETSPVMRGLSYSSRFGIGQVDPVTSVETATGLGSLCKS